ncbi:MAG: hypothetical protein ACR2OS_03065, partial [Paracoccaceae bacterium]
MGNIAKQDFWRKSMTFYSKMLGAAATAAVASFAFAGAAQADVCNTPSKLGDMGNFNGEVITIA